MAKSALEGGGFRMKHYNIEVWSAYVEGRLPAENQHEYEDHLYGCDACMQLYTECISSLEIDSVASISSDTNEAFIEQIMVRIESEKKQLRKLSTPFHKPALYRKPVFQYALAAAITIILMTTGIFQGITSGIEQSPTTTTQTLDASYTDQLMDKTVAMLDAIQLKAKLIEKGGVNHE
jgi:anti-sigma factor RsiW